MQNKKILNSENLLHNLKKFGDKKICAMVKANAYGHGLNEIVQLVENHVEYFGVVSIDEAKKIRKLTKKPILICAKVHDYEVCLEQNFDIIVDDEESLKKAVQCGCKSNLHLKINCGMNRFGIKSTLNAKMINEFLVKNKISLKSICTHFPITQNKRKTLKNYKSFMKVRAEITENVPLCFGGTGISKYPFNFDILRLGIGMYGYEEKGLLPVMQVCSFVSKIFFASKGEFLGYGKKYKAHRSGWFAIVPIGYADGLRRALSGKFSVKIKGKRFQSVGNICMDCFFVQVDKSVEVGDEVVVMADARQLAKTSGTISYEILTGFSNLRGQTIITSRNK